ncbi:MAG: O-antigen ligase family protein [Candidatus Levybacteria bacterium]|nr:O-antigen ligase family protein [Candidatus Levybacteria bacterium]
MTIIKICNRIIEYSFYLLFILVPLIFTSNTSELFEFNKIWITFAFTIIIAGAWATKMIVQRKILIQKTPLDIPILLFLSSQIISTFLSLDMHVSLWGYYSRFNGGLFSIFSYILLYYAFVTNFVSGKATHNTNLPQTDSNGNALHNAHNKMGWKPKADILGITELQALDAKTMIKRIIKISFITGFLVVLWGIPSHFGHDPTCLLFRGNFDVSCWTDAFRPTVRIFSTLGQPAWLAAYLAILTPIATAFGIQKIQNSNKTNTANRQSLPITNKKSQSFLKYLPYFILSSLFYLSILYTDARAGLLAIWTALFVLLLAYVWLQKEQIFKLSLLNSKYLLAVFICMGVLTFFNGTPFGQLTFATFTGIKSKFFVKPVEKAQPVIEKPKKPSSTPSSPITAGQGGGTASEKIRMIVWQGAIDGWKNNPLFGTGVETFAFAYYKYRPAAHNLTSEWDYLYNKAHNEYLNFLTTTGILGLGSYLLMIGLFIFLALKKLIARNVNFELCILNFAFLASYIGILISNFFGFSVVIVNLYFFLIPAFVFILQEMINTQKIFLFPNGGSFPSYKNNELKISTAQWISISVLIFSILYLLFTLFTYWDADTNYALGYNYDRVGQYQQASPLLRSAVAKRSDEPTFWDELSSNDAILSASFAYQKDLTMANKLAEEAINISNSVTTEHPNNLVFWKTRVRVFYTLSQSNPQYLNDALKSIIKANELAPTDAKIAYNLGVLYGQTGNIEKGIEALEKTIKLKPDYRDAYYALGLFYREASNPNNGKPARPEFQKKAIETMRYILQRFNTNDNPAKEALKSWGAL